jgi:hypothetical protein
MGELGHVHAAYSSSGLSVEASNHALESLLSKEEKLEDVKVYNFPV